MSAVPSSEVVSQLQEVDGTEEHCAGPGGELEHDGDQTHPEEARSEDIEAGAHPPHTGPRLLLQADGGEAECGQGEEEAEVLTPPPGDGGDLHPGPEDEQLEDHGGGGVNVGRHCQQVGHSDSLLDPREARHQAVEGEQQGGHHQAAQQTSAPHGLVLGQEVEAEHEVRHCITHQQHQQQRQQTGHCQNCVSLSLNANNDDSTPDRSRLVTQRNETDWIIPNISTEIKRNNSARYCQLVNVFIFNPDLRSQTDPQHSFLFIFCLNSPPRSGGERTAGVGCERCEERRLSNEGRGNNTRAAADRSK